MPADLPLRYVVLCHEGVAEPHYDLLFERSPGAELTSVHCTDWPPTASTPLTRVPDHRRLYLDYEGPISHNRGQVRRVAAGLCTTEADSEGSFLLRLDNGQELHIPRH